MSATIPREDDEEVRHARILFMTKSILERCGITINAHIWKKVTTLLRDREGASTFVASIVVLSGMELPKPRTLSLFRKAAKSKPRKILLSERFVELLYLRPAPFRSRVMSMAIVCLYDAEILTQKNITDFTSTQGNNTMAIALLIKMLKDNSILHQKNFNLLVLHRGKHTVKALLRLNSNRGGISDRDFTKTIEHCIDTYHLPTEFATFAYPCQDPPQESQATSL